MNTNRYRVGLIVLALSLLVAAASAQAQNTAAPVRISGQYSTTYYAGLPNDWNIFSVLLPVLSNDRRLPYTERFDLRRGAQITGTLQGAVAQGEYTINLPAEPSESGWYDTDGDPETASPVKVFMVGIASGLVEETYVSRYDFLYTRSFNYDPNSQVTAGELLVWSAVDGATLPILSGDDHLYYTQDDVLVKVPAGWSLFEVYSDGANHSVTPLNDANPVIQLREPPLFEDVYLDDLTYAEAFTQLMQHLERTYVFTEYRHIDWRALDQRFSPKAAQVTNDREFHSLLESALFSFYDGHLAIFGPGIPEWIGGSLGLQVYPVDGELMIIEMLDGLPFVHAPQIKPGVVITGVNGLDAMAFFERVPRTIYSTGHESQSRWMRGVLAFRGVPGTVFTLDYRLPDGTTGQVVAETVGVASFRGESSGPANSAPVTYKILDSGVGYVKIDTFSSGRVDDYWDNAMYLMTSNNVPGIIIDLRDNGGGFSGIGNYMLGDFLDDDLYAGQEISTVDKDGDNLPDVDDEFYYGRKRIYDPSKLVVLVGPNCFSACELAAQGFQDIGATVVGHLTSGGAGGGVGATYFLPGGTQVYGMAIVMSTDPQGKVRIEGTGVRLDVTVPFTADGIASGEDLVLAAAESVITGN